jgi:fructose-1,6-bisphosphatase I / sedoheptulose-1,7-bisphosphatase
MLADHTTLAQFLVEERRRHPTARADLDSLVLDVALACKAVANRVALGALRGTLGRADRTNVHGEVQHELDVLANDCFLRATERSGCLAGMASEELDDPYVLPSEHPRGNYLLVFDPLDGSSNIDVNVSVGSIFSILHAPEPGADAAARDFLQPGTAQVCAGYALYGPATMLVLTLGRGVHAFTLDPALGEFVLTREAIRVPPLAGGFVVDASDRRFREPAVRQVASLAAETHRILTRGGVFLGPRHELHAANAVALLVEQAGGAASTGRERVLDVVPTDLHQRSPLIFGTAAEVALVNRYRQQHDDRPYDSPLYGGRGLFRVGAG